MFDEQTALTLYFFDLQLFDLQIHEDKITRSKQKEQNAMNTDKIIKKIIGSVLQ